MALYVNNPGLSARGYSYSAAIAASVTDSLSNDPKLSQTDMAKQLSTSVSAIKNYERYEMTPSIDVAKKLAPFLI